MNSENVDPYRIYLGDRRRGEAAGHAAETDLYPLDRYYREKRDRRHIRSELDELFRSHKADLVFGMHHYAPSPTWRDEIITDHLNQAHLSRFVVRVHVFESTGRDSVGRYLGFVALRPPGAAKGQEEIDTRLGFRFVVEAEMLVPGYMSRPRYHVLQTTTSSARLGVLPFRSAVFSCPKQEQAEADDSVCVHLATSQALHLIMGRFGCRPISQVEFNHLLWKVTNTLPGEEGELPKSAKEIRETGAPLKAALKVVRESCDGGGFTYFGRVKADVKTPYSEGVREVHRTITDTLACGLPIIALIDGWAISGKSNPTGKPWPHAVLVLGMHLLHAKHECDDLLHEPQSKTAGIEDAVAADVGGGAANRWEQIREDHAELPGRLVIHDSLARGPFFEWRFQDFINAAVRAHPDAERQGVYLIALGPQGMKVGIDTVRIAAENRLSLLLGNLGIERNHEIRALREYIDRFVNADDREEIAKLGSWLLLTRLLPGRELRKRFSLAEDHANFLQEKGYFWAVEVRYPKAILGTEPNRNIENFVPAALVFAWPIDSEFEDEKEGAAPPDPIVLSPRARGGEETAGGNSKSGIQYTLIQ